jgi:hypothetical protein
MPAPEPLKPREEAGTVAAAPNRLRVDDPCRGPGLTALASMDRFPQPIVELCDQPVLVPAPAAEDTNVVEAPSTKSLQGRRRGRAGSRRTRNRRTGAVP